MLSSRTVAVLLLTAICSGLFSIVAAAARIVDIHDGETVLKVVTTKTSPNEIIEQAGIELEPADEVDASGLNDETGPYIEINRSCDVQVTNGKQIKGFKLVAGTVGEALDKAGYEIDEDDVVEPSLDTPLTDGVHIDVDIVECVESVETQTIPYETVTTETDELYKGSKKTKTAGVNGEKQLVWAQKYVNGELTENELIDETVTREPVTEEILIGTKQPVVSNPSGSIKITANGKISQLAEPSWLELDDNGIPVNYTKVLEGSATAYSPEDGTITATGKRAQPGYIAVNPKQIPYGTEMYIVSADGKYVYGYAIAADTGGFANSGRTLCDLFFNTAGECIQFGRRDVRIYILK